MGKPTLQTKLIETFPPGRFDHIHSIFAEVQHSKTLEELNLDFSEVFFISSELFARSLANLRKVKIL